MVRGSKAYFKKHFKAFFLLKTHIEAVYLLGIENIVQILRQTTSLRRSIFCVYDFLCS